MNTIAPPPVLDHLSALGDETRTRLLALLERGEFNVSELCQALQLPQPTVSRHLRTLGEDGWLVVRSEGRQRHYQLSDQLSDTHQGLWNVVKAGLRDFHIYRNDADRAREVLAERKRKSAAFFAASADQWGELRREIFGARAEFLPLLGFLNPSWTVGDLGTGTGGLAETVAPFVARVVGVDRSRPMLDAAAERMEGLGSVELRQGELESLPVADGELDVAVLSLVLHYVVEPEAALKEAFRALAPGGRLVVVDMAAHDRGPRYAEEMGHVWPGFEQDQMESWLEEAGFQRMHTFPLAPDPNALGPGLFMTMADRP